MNPGTRRVILANLMVPVIAWFVWDQVERRALARDVAALAARGEPTTAAAMPAGADTQQRRHAARVYAAALEHAQALQPEVTFRLSRLDVDSQTVVINLDELERTYPPNAPYLQLIHQAAALDFNGFGALRDQAQLQTLATLGNLCALDADVHSARGRSADAAASLASCARLLRTMATFRRFQLSTRLLGSTRILLRHGRPPAERLAALHDAFTGLPDTDSVADDVRESRVVFLERIEGPAQRLTGSMVRVLFRPWITRKNREELRRFDDALTLASQPWPQKYLAATELARRLGQEFGRGQRGLIDAQVPPRGIAFAGFAAGPAGIDLAARRTIVAALAVERFRAAHGGALPASLAALVPAYLREVPLDPFTGRPIVYTSSPSGYAVYSLDTDMKDDGGVLYGVGSRSQRQPQQGTPRDLGIRVEIGR